MKLAVGKDAKRESFFSYYSFMKGNGMVFAVLGLGIWVNAKVEPLEALCLWGSQMTGNQISS